MDDYEEIKRLVDSDEYQLAQEKISLLKYQLKKSNPFNIDMRINDAQIFFSNIENTNPVLYTAVQIQRKEIQELIYYIQKGKRVRFD